MISPQSFNQAIAPMHRETCREILMKLELAQGFELLFIECNSPVLQEQVENYLKEQNSDFTWLKVRFDAEIRNLREELLDRDLPIDTSSVISIRGLQHSIHSQKSAADVVARLNVARDLLPQQFPCPLILWLPVYALQNFSRFAPDLWSWRGGVFYFEEQARQEQFSLRGEMLSLSGDHESDNYSKAFREGEIEFLTPLVEAFDSVGASPRSLKKHARNIYELANHHYRLSHFDEALPLLKEAEKIYRDIGDKTGEGTILNNLSQIYYPQGDYGMAQDYLEKSLMICRELGDEAGEVTALNNLGQIYEAQGDYKVALGYFEQSLTIQQKLDDNAEKGRIFNNLGTLAYAQGDYGTALKYWGQSLAIQLEFGDKAGEGRTLNNISTLVYAQGDYKTALRYLEQSLVIFRELGDKLGLSATLFNIGHIQRQNGEQRQAITTWLSVYQLAKEINLNRELNELEKLAGQLGLEGGLEGWERLLQQMDGE